MEKPSFAKHETIIAFTLLIFAILYLATIAAVMAFHGKYSEALGFGGLTTGLVGILGTFKPRAETAGDAATREAISKIPTPEEPKS